MPFNLSGVLVSFQLLVNPKVIIPDLIVKDIRQLDFKALKNAGYRGAVFDKDNCLTIPYKDTLVPQLQEAWNECQETFGPGNVIIVSNSAGSSSDVGGIWAESVSHHLGVPVLFHASPKPSYSCINSVKKYFSSLKSPIVEDELVVIGDRVFTDVVLANRMKQKRLQPQSAEANSEKATRRGPLAVLTVGVWQRENMFMRAMENKMVNLVGGATYASPRRFVKPFVEEKVEVVQESGMNKLFSWLRRKP